jgi:hypothetical protein
MVLPVLGIRFRRSILQIVRSALGATMSSIVSRVFRVFPYVMLFMYIITRGREASRVRECIVYINIYTCFSRSYLDPPLSDVWRGWGGLRTLCAFEGEAWSSLVYVYAPSAPSPPLSGGGDGQFTTLSCTLMWQCYVMPFYSFNIDCVP